MEFKTEIIFKVFLVSFYPLITMIYTVFYSWQSDLENKFNRSFIENSLIKATKELSRDVKYKFEAIIDRDTFGIYGSPSIVDSITIKIANADVFVCDVSIVNSKQSGRLTPNPNVIFELGYASSILGWDRIIMIQNTAFGDINSLPFDLRGRRVLPYFLNESIESKSEVRSILNRQLVESFKIALQPYSQSYWKKIKAIWWGNWIYESKIKECLLDINRTSSDSFFFRLTLIDGGKTGEIQGKAKITSPHLAFAVIDIGNDKNCEIYFRRILRDSEWYMDINVSSNCFVFHGNGTTFNGEYKYKSEQLVGFCQLDEIYMNEISRVTGKYLAHFLNNFQQVNDSGWQDNLRVIKGWVKGYSSICESIVVLDIVGDVWCAFTDQDGSKVRCFSSKSVLKDDNPEEIVQWLLKFQGKWFFENE